ncbi:hypothetical protein MXB_4155 [Myxobolus squamalis]|nr:hypothetical protein MXB_4155 [Myxobolus squamalis]
MIAPIDMISILSQSEKTQVRLIRVILISVLYKDYVAECFNRANSVITKNNEAIEKDKQEIDEIKKDINIIETG